MKKYALFIGRWQTWHKGHQWLIDQQFEKGKNVWIAIRDVNRDENNPKTAHEIMLELTELLRGYISTGRLYISIIPGMSIILVLKDQFDFIIILFDLIISSELFRFIYPLCLVGN